MPAELSKDKRITLHFWLALALCHKDFGAPVQRMYIIWEILRTMGQTWYYIDEIVPEFAKVMKLNRNTIRRCIKVGLEMGFFKKGRDKHGHIITIVGLDRVYNAWLPDSDGKKFPPGVAVQVNMSDLLNSSLQQLRSLLLFILTAKNPRQLSRAFMAALIGRCKQTINNYYNARPIRRKFVFRVQKFNDNYEVVSQMSNVYDGTGKYFPRDNNPQQAWDGYTDYHVTDQRDTRNRKVNHHTESNARQALKARIKRNFPNPETFFPVEIPNWKDKHKYVESTISLDKKQIPVWVRTNRLKKLVAKHTNDYIIPIPVLTDTGYNEIMYCHPEKAMLLNDYDMPEHIIIERQYKLTNAPAFKLSYVNDDYLIDMTKTKLTSLH